MRKKPYCLENVPLAHVKNLKTENFMIKKGLAFLLLLSIFLLCMAGCGKREENGTLKIVCTVFSVYEWTRNIVGDVEGVEIVWLVRNGTDVHSYQPTTADIVDMLSCDLLVYIGGETETWVEKSLEHRKKDECTMLDLSDADGVVLREVSAESIIGTEDQEASHEHDHNHAHTHGAMDEHIWLSLRNAEACSRAIAEAICQIDPAREDVYRDRLQSYVAQMRELDEAYQNTIAEASEPTLLFADRFPFVYLAEDYGIRYVAAFEGCSTESEVTPETILHLAHHADQWDLRWIMVTESSDGTLAQGIIRATEQKNQRVAVLDSMQSVDWSEMESGESYLGIMERNLSVLRQVLLP